jgi:hypothetical protein
MGLDPSVIVDSEKPDAQLERGEIDVIPTWVDMTLNHVDKGYAVRPIGLDTETYATYPRALPLPGRARLPSGAARARGRVRAGVACDA